MTTTNANGTNPARASRKSLADQIDRLDGILDGLAEALDESVADAVKGVIARAVREAVGAAVQEVLDSPDLLRAALEKHAPPPPAPAPAPERPTLREKIAGTARRICEKTKRAATLAKEKLKGACDAARMVATVAPAVLGAAARKAWDCRKPFATAVAVGVACAAVCHLGGPLLSVAANALGGAALALSAMTSPLKRLFRGGNA